MAKEPQANVPALPIELVNIAVTLDKDDVAAILMSRAEDFLKGEIKKHQKQEKVCEEARKTLADQLQKQLAEVAAAHFETAIETMTEAARRLKVKDIKATTAYRYHDLDDNGNGTVDCNLLVTGEKPSINWTVVQEAKMPASVKETLKQQAANSKADKDNNEAWMIMRRKLYDLPTLERRAKAAVAEQRLRSSAEGKELVDMLDAQLEASIKQLGVN